jgi:acetaldehyde dehydrogenase (acetylating)
MISAADLEAVRKLDATVRDEALDDLSALPSVAAVLAYLATQARAEGEDEADWVEMVVRLAEMPPGAVRAVLRPSCGGGLLSAIQVTQQSK